MQKKREGKLESLKLQWETIKEVKVIRKVKMKMKLIQPIMINKVKLVKIKSRKFRTKSLKL